MKMKRNSRGPSRAVGRLAVAALIACSCASTKIDDVWVPKEAPGRTYQRLMIIALTQRPGARAQYENDFVDKLSNVKVRAIASINVVPDVGDIDRKTVEAWLEKFELDGVVVTRVVNVARKVEYIPPTYTLGGWYGAWAVPTSPGAVVEKTTVSLETDLFDASTEKLVYSAVTRSFDPSSRTKAIHAVIDALAKDMTERGYLPSS